MLKKLGASIALAGLLVAGGAMPAQAHTGGYSFCGTKSVNWITGWEVKFLFNKDYWGTQRYYQHRNIYTGATHTALHYCPYAA